MMFSCLTLNVQPLHIDFEFASKTEFGKPLVNSLFTLGLMIGMTVNGHHAGHHHCQTWHERRAVLFLFFFFFFPKPLLPWRHHPCAHHRQIGTREQLAAPSRHTSSSSTRRSIQHQQVVAICVRQR